MSKGRNENATCNYGSSDGSVQMISRQRGTNIISGTSVTVQALGSQYHQPVQTTPLHSRSQLPSDFISKVLLKFTTKENKKDSKTFTLRNISSSTVSTCCALKTLIGAQLSAEVMDNDFDVGYQQGNVIVSIRSADDLSQLWSSIIAGKNVILWCDGLRRPIQSKRSIGEYSDDDTDSEELPRKNRTSKPRKKKKKEVDHRNEAVEQTIEDLKRVHSSSGYTPMQLRIWSEMYNGGVYSSLNEPPTSTMFVSAGTPTVKKTFTKSDSLTQPITQIATALSPGTTSSSRGPMLAVCPAKVIENRSECYKQLADLSNLKQSGLLDDEEYAAERQAIMEVLKKLKNNK